MRNISIITLFFFIYISMCISSQTIPSNSIVIPNINRKGVLSPDFKPFIPIEPKYNGNTFDIPGVIDSVNTQYGVYNPSDFEIVNGKKIDINKKIFNDKNKLTNEELQEIFYIPINPTINNPSLWQDYFNTYLNVAYNSVQYFFEDNDGQIIMSKSGKVNTSGKYKNAIIIMDMGLYKNIDYKGQKRKVGYLFRIKIDVSIINTHVLDVSDIFSIAVSTKSGIIGGSIETSVLGISGNALKKFLVQLTSLNNDSIQRSITSIAILNNKIVENSSDIFINPELYPEDI
jgi:hypothetical protein